MAIDPYNEILPSMHQMRSASDGRRSYMLKIYNYMSLALAMTGVIAYGCAHSTVFLNAMYVVDNGAIVGMKALAWIVMLAPLALVVYLSLGLQRMSVGAAQAGYWIYTALVGMSLSVVFLTFTDASIAQIFFVTASVFGSMSLYGHTTGRDLTGMGNFLLMALWGLIIAMLVNLFLRSSGLEFSLSAIGVLIFTGLTAYDTQKLLRLYDEFSASSEGLEKIAIMGALTLYLDFINIFLNLLTLFGKRRK